MSDLANVELVRTIVKEYADQTNHRVETYHKQTTEAIQQMALSISDMAKSVQKSSEDHARNEERQTATLERMERIDQSVQKLGVTQRNFEKETDDKIDKIREEVQNNSLVRKVTVWLAATVIAAMIGGGILFSSLTGKAAPQLKGEQHENPTNEKKDT